MTRYRGVMFDLGGTLFYDLPSSSVSGVQMRVLLEAGVPAERLVGLEGAFRQARTAVEADLRSLPGYLHRELVERHFLAGAAATGAMEYLDDPAASAARYRDLMRTAVVSGLRLRRDCHESLAVLSALGCDLTVVSNNDDGYLQALIRKWRLDLRLRRWLSSDAAGVCKPDPRIFNLGLGDVDFPLDDVLYVGDSVADDVDGARAAGMDVALLAEGPPPAGAERATYLISSLAQLPALVAPA